MLQQIPIQALPNQSFNILLDGNAWEVAIRLTNGVMSVSLTLNGNNVVDNARAVAGALIIPSQYQEAGNFIFITTNNQLPDYTLFGVTQSLVYASADDLASFRAAPAPRITADFFNPAGALPLRFKPQGYVLS